MSVCFVTKREARKEIKLIPKHTSIFDPFETRREFYKAVLDKELPHFFLSSLLDFEKRSDELPERLTSSSQREADKKSPLKCNYSTIAGLEEILGLLLAQKLVKDSSVLEGINTFIQYKWNAKQPCNEPENAPRTTPDELKLINGTIGLVKNYLIEKYACNIHYNKLHYWVAALFHLKPPKNSPTPKWRARVGLRTLRKSGPDEIKVFKPYFEAIINGKVPEYRLGLLKQFKDYSDDLPFHEDKDKRLALVWNHPSYPNFKCRGNVLCGISMGLQGVVYEGLVKDPAVILAINNFRYHNFNAFRGNKGEYWTTPDEIAFINRTLDTVIDYLKREYKLE